MLALPAVMSAATSLVSYAGQQASFTAERSRYEQNQRNALAADKDTQDALTMRQMQEQQLVSQRLTASQLDEARRIAEAQVTGADSGNVGISLDNIVADISRRSEDNRATLLTNWHNTAAQLQSEKDAANDTEMRQVNNEPSGTEPNPLTPIVGIGSAVAQYGASEAKQTRLSMDPQGA